MRSILLLFILALTFNVYASPLGKKKCKTKSKEVEILIQSVTIANNLFNSARADYAEVLLTQREALEAKIELIEIKMKQLNGKINIYKALGGGWN